MSNDITDIEAIAPWIEMFIATWMKEQLGQEVDSESNLAALGVESVHAGRFTDDLAEFIGANDVPVQWLLDHPTAGDLARHLAMVITQKTRRMADPTSA